MKRIIDSFKTNSSTIDLNSGNLSITHYSGELHADVSSGRLNIQMDKLMNSVKIKVSSGLVQLDLPDNANFTLNGEVQSDNVSCDFPLLSKKMNKKKITCTHGTGKYNIDFDVSSGIIRIF